jgi:hypothetical protein
MNRAAGFFLFVCVVMLCGVLTAVAQFTTASLAGVVTDSSGAVIPAAKLTLTNQQTGLSHSLLSDVQGHYLFTALPVGHYQLVVEKTGFTAYKQTGIELTVNQSATQNVSLQIGKVTEEVTVGANVELINTREATVGQLIDERRIVDLPLDGRNAADLALLGAGTVNVSSINTYCDVNCEGGTHPGERRINVNGIGPNAVNYQLDGASHNDTYINTNLPFPNPDAVQEFTIQSDNLSAEYGNAAAGAISVITKSGTNQLHGDVFEFLRNGALNANNYFANQSTPVQKDVLKRNQFGGSVGGPIVKGKLFYFATYQGTRLRSAGAGNVAFVPTQAERTGDFSALCGSFDAGGNCTDPNGVQLVDPTNGNAKIPFNQLPQIDPVAQFFLQHIPLPNGGGNILNFLGPPQVQNEDEAMGKLDYSLGKNHRFSGHYFQTYFRQPPASAQQNLLAADSNGNHVRVQNVAVNHTYTKSPTLLFNTWFGWELQTGGSLSGAPFGLADAGMNVAQTKPAELSVFVNNYFSINTNHNGDFDRGDTTIRENVTLVHNRHELHFGGELVRLTNHLRNEYLQNANIGTLNALSGDNLADFMLGVLSYFQQGGGEFKDLHGEKYSLYVNDIWRANPKLSLNAGLRWDPYLPYLEEKGRVVCFQPGVPSQRFRNAPLGMTFGGSNHDPGCPKAGAEAGLGNFAPRLGFAYRPGGDDKTSIRGGAGYYYAPPETVGFNTFVDAAPFSPQFFFSTASLTDPYGSNGLANPFPVNYAPRLPGANSSFILPTAIYAVFQRTYHITLVTAWNLTLERQLGEDWLFRSAYVGNKGTFLYGTSDQKPLRELNPAVYMPGATHDNTQQRRLYPQFSTVGYISSSNNSHYNALQTTLEKRMSRGLSILGNWTWARGIDDYGWADPFNRHFDYGLSDDDIHHNFKLSSVWDLPKTSFTGAAGKVLNGWAVTSIVSWRGGFPYSIVDSSDNSFSGVGRDRADLVGSLRAAVRSSSRPHAQLVQEWFNPTVFADNAVGTFGNSGKNILRGPRFFETDLGLMKTTQITERTSAQFRAEFFNAFNNVNFSRPHNDIRDPQVAQITGLDGKPRILQFALKLMF